MLSCRYLIFGAVLINVMCAIGSGQAPTPPKGVSGYTVSIQEDWVAPDQGFVPVRVKIETNPALATTQDERFAVSYFYRNYSEPDYVVTSSVVIEAGTKSGTTEFYVDAARLDNSYRSQLLVEKGEYDGRFNPNDILLTTPQTASSYGTQPTILVISKAFPEANERSFVCYKNKMKEVPNLPKPLGTDIPLPNFDQLELIYDNDLYVNNSAANTLKTGIPGVNQAVKNRAPVTVIDQNPRMSGIRHDRLPADWIGLTGVEQIILSMNELRLICTKQPNDRANLEKWVAAGGVLIVTGTGPKFEKANNILPQLLGPDRSTFVRRNAPKWRLPSDDVNKLTRLLARENDEENYIRNYGNRYINYSTATVESPETEVDFSEFLEVTDFGEVPGGSKFVFSPYLNGLIVAVGDDMSKWHAEDWRLLNNTLIVGGQGIHQKIGPSTGAFELATFKIPGVGEPPIVMFYVLISLFLLLAGPVMLLILKRTGQMQLLFVVVPALSFLVCSSLFGYAIVVDGSNRWGRSQSVTTIDHRTNMAVTHARATYYSGNRPAAYEFEKDTVAMTPMKERSKALRYDFALGNHRISGAEMSARTPHQVATVRSQLANQRLILVPKGDDSDTVAPTVQNQLGAEVLMAFIKTDQGIFCVENLLPDQTITATEILPLDANVKVSQNVNALSPQQINPRNYYSRVVTDDSGWGEEIRVVELLRSGGLTELLKEPNTYVAILKQFPLVAEQIEPVQYKMQLHAVRGKW